MAQGDDDVSQSFQYEMSAYPISLFKDGYMRKPVKSKLRKALIDDKVNEAKGEWVFVLDGGALLHKVRWAKGATYKQLAEQYVKYVRNKFGQSFLMVTTLGLISKITSINAGALIKANQPKLSLWKRILQQIDRMHFSQMIGTKTNL